MAFTQFGSELDKATQAQLTRGERMVEILKQGQYEPLPISKQVIIIFAGTNGYLDDLPIAGVLKFESELYAYMDKHCPDIEKEIETKGILTDEMIAKLSQSISSFKTEFKEAHKL